MSANARSSITASVLTADTLMPRSSLLRVVRGHMGSAIGRLLGLGRLDELYDAAATGDVAGFADRLLASLGVHLDVGPDTVAIPREGPLIVVANHPFGAVEGLALISLMQSIRSDVRVLANHLLGAIPEVRDLSFLVDPFATQGSVRSNIRGIAGAMRWVRQGGALIVFPAGEVSHKRPGRPIEDPEWSANMARLVRGTGAAVTPIFIHGHNGPLFQAAGLVHPRLRTLLLPRELTNKRGATIRLEVGSTIQPERLASIDGDAEMMRYLRDRTYLLRGRERRAASERGRTWSGGVRARASLIPPVDPGTIAAELRRLPACQLLISQGDYDVYYATADQIPNGLREIGRLREEAFRAAGEGAGVECDIDSFDRHYHHLFLWHRSDRAIAGAYRIGAADHIVRWFGVAGLYTSTLFRYDTRLIDTMGPALELGRSFVALPYQRSYAPLLLLWKGIGAYVVLHPAYRTLFGPVSISDEYTSTSQRLMSTFLEMHTRDARLAPLVRAHRPPPDARAIGQALGAQVRTVEDVAMLVREVEQDDRGLPVLLRQYLKLGGRLLGLNVDPRFSNVLDALICVDLTRTERSTLERYMGASGASTFLARHSRSVADQAGCRQTSERSV